MQPYPQVRKIANAMLKDMSDEQVAQEHLYNWVEKIVVQYNLATLSDPRLQRAQNRIVELREGKNLFAEYCNFFWKSNVGSAHTPQLYIVLKCYNLSHRAR